MFTAEDACSPYDGYPTHGPGVWLLEIITHQESEAGCSGQ